MFDMLQLVESVVGTSLAARQAKEALAKVDARTAATTWNRERQRPGRHKSLNLLDNQAGRCRSRFQSGRSRLHSAVDVLLFLQEPL